MFLISRFFFLRGTAHQYVLNYLASLSYETRASVCTRIQVQIKLLMDMIIDCFLYWHILANYPLGCIRPGLTFPVQLTSKRYRQRQDMPQGSTYWEWDLGFSLLIEGKAKAQKKEKKPFFRTQTRHFASELLAYFELRHALANTQEPRILLNNEAFLKGAVPKSLSFRLHRVSSRAIVSMQLKLARGRTGFIMTFSPKEKVGSEGIFTTTNLHVADSCL